MTRQLKSLIGSLYSMMVLLPLSVIFYTFFKKKFISPVDQKKLWQSRKEVDWEQICAVEKDPYYQFFDHFIFEKLKGLDVSNFLEIGCYYGYRLNKFSMNLPEKSFFGLDIGFDNLSMGQKKLVWGSSVGLVNGDACALPFKDRSIEAIYTVVCLTHIDYSHIGRAIDELVRVCSKELLLVEVDHRCMKFRKKLSCLNWGYGYMHAYEKAVGERMRLVSITPLYDADHHPRYTVFHFSNI